MLIESMYWDYSKNNIENYRMILERKFPEIEPNIGDRKLVIWGTGDCGKATLKYLKNKGYTCVFFVDSDMEKQTICDGVIVKSPNVLDVKEHYVIVAIFDLHISIEHMVEMRGYTLKDYIYVMDNTRYSVNDFEYKGVKIGRYTNEVPGILSEFPLVKSIGRFCSINPSAKVVVNHTTMCVSTHNMLQLRRYNGRETCDTMYKYIDKYGKYEDDIPCGGTKICNNPPVVIGNDVWIGSNVIILPGVKVGDGAILSAGAVVSKNVEPYSIVGGVPAKHIKYRFPKAMREAFLRIKWWDWPVEKIKENIELFYQPELFCQIFDTAEGD